MSIWQRIGKTLEPLGNALDPDKWLPGGKDAAFTLALVALSAKMAVADGVVTVSEVRAFKSSVEISAGEAEQIERFFSLAQRDVAGYRSYARKIRKLFQDSPETLEHVLDALFHIASADGMIHEGELEYLRVNPKLSIFFLAFLPQFVPAGASGALMQMLGLGGMFMAMTFGVFVVYGAFAAWAGQKVLASVSIMGWMRKTTALVFAGLGLRLALAER